MARGDLNSAARLKVSHRDADRRRRRDADILDATPGGQQSRDDGVSQHLSARSAVA